MTLPSRSLIKVVNKLKSYHVDVRMDDSSIKINIDLAKTDFLKISSLLYLILNKFENLYFIVIEGIPYCLMRDAAHHIICSKKDGVHYQKDGICRKCKYHDLCPGWKEHNRKKARPPAVSHLPREIVFEVTKKCNLNCPLCFSAKSAEELPLPRIKTILNECARLGIKNVRFTGGEPLIYNNIEEALRYAKHKDLYVIVNTNATLLNKKTERVFKNCADNLLISLQGFNVSSERRLTQSMVNFKEKLRNIVELNSKIADVRVGTIISKTLIDNFPKYFYLIKKLGIKHWELYRPMFDVASGDFKVSSQDFRKLMKYVHIRKLLGNDILIANPLPFCITKNFNLSRHVLYGAESDDGHSRMVCDVRGFLKPSYFIPEDLGTTIKDAWRKPFLKRLHYLDYLPQKCQDCFYLKWCKGGSRHWAKLANGSYFTRDPLMDTR